MASAISPERQPSHPHTGCERMLDAGGPGLRGSPCDDQPGAVSTQWESGTPGVVKRHSKASFPHCSKKRKNEKPKPKSIMPHTLPPGRALGPGTLKSNSSRNTA